MDNLVSGVADVRNVFQNYQTLSPKYDVMNLHLKVEMCKKWVDLYKK